MEEVKAVETKATTMPIPQNLKAGGIQETKDMLVAINELILCFIKIFKDGVNIPDFVKLMEELHSNQNLRSKLANAYDGYQKIPGELASLTTSESFSIMLVQMGYLAQIIDALKK